MSESNQLPAETLAAIAGLVKTDAAKKAKAELADGSTRTVRGLLRFEAIVKKGKATPGGSGTRAAEVDLHDADFLLAVFAKLGIGEKRLRGAVALVTEGITSEAAAEEVVRGEPVTKLREALKAEADELNARLPAVPFTGKPRAAKVEVDPQLIELVEEEI